ncbi:MAG: FG-GAP-like repeat-containing protein [Candidatus Paceibacterota bacterium]
MLSDDTGASAVFIFNANSPKSTAKLLSIQEGGVDQAYFDATGGLYAASSTLAGNLTVNGSGTSSFKYGLTVATSGGSVGIGTSTPAGKFEVAGTAYLRGSRSGIGLYVNSSGNVGIGTESQSVKLEVYSSTGRNILATTQTTLPPTLMTSVPLASVFSGSGSPAAQFIASETGNSYISDVIRGEAYRTSSSAFNLLNLMVDADGSTSTKFVVKGNGDIGIGTSTPAFNIHAVPSGGSGQYSMALEGWGVQPNYPVLYGRRAGGSISSPSAVQSGYNLLVLAGRGYDGTTFPSGSNAAIFLNAAENFSTTNQGSSISFEVTPIGSTASQRTEMMRIDHSGMIGIGDTSPDAMIDVSSSTASALFRVDDDGEADTTPFFINGSGYVGVGTTAPTSTLTVGGVANSTPWMTIGNGSASTTIGGYSLTSTSTHPYGINLATLGGNVGIGTLAPTAKLDVTGDVSIDSASNSSIISIKNNGSDIFTVSATTSTIASTYVVPAFTTSTSLGNNTIEANPWVTFTGTVVNNGDSFGSSIASAGDVNGDGYNDVIVGAYASPNRSSYIGAAYLYYGGPNMDSAADVTFSGVLNNDMLGTSIASAGDINGDGYDDVLIGAPGASSGLGQVYLYYGGSAMDSTADVTFTGLESGGSGFGQVTASDVNGDGYNDVVIGANTADGEGISDRGEVYIYYGGPNMDNEADVVLAGSTTETLGLVVSSLGDVNGDGYGDIVACSQHGDYGAGVNTGEAIIFYGGAKMDNTADVTIIGSAIEDRLGYSCAGGDVNGDGFDDAIVGAPYNDTDGVDRGQIYVYYGGPSMDNVADITITGTTDGLELGTYIAYAGDINGDGYGDIGASGDNSLYIYHGGPSMDTTADETVVNSEGTTFGYPIAAVGDVNGDGFGEIMTSARQNTSAFPKSYIYRGQPSAWSTIIANNVFSALGLNTANAKYTDEGIITEGHFAINAANWGISKTGASAFTSLYIGGSTTSTNNTATTTIISGNVEFDNNNFYFDSNNNVLGFSGTSTFASMLGEDTAVSKAFVFNVNSAKSNAQLWSLQEAGTNVAYFDSSGGLFAPSSTLSGGGTTSGRLMIGNGSVTSTLIAGNRGTATSTIYSDLSIVNRDLVIGGVSGSGNLWAGNGSATSSLTGSALSIGTTAATSTLTVYNSSNPWLTIGNGSASTTIGGYSATATTTNPYGIVMATNGGIVGIGTASPSGKFSVGGVATDNAYLFYDNDDVGDTTDGQSLYVYRRAAEGDYYIRSYINQFKSATISSNSNLLFDTAAGGGGYVYFLSNDDIYFNIGTNKDLLIRDHSSNALMDVDEATGKVGIGTASPYDKLSVSGGNLSVFNNSATATISGSSTSSFPYGITLASSGGNVGIGTANPAALLHLGKVGTTAGDGIQFGDDVNVFRSGTNQLKIDDGLIVTSDLYANGNFAVAGKIYGQSSSLYPIVFASRDTGKEWARITDGTFLVGNGTATTTLNIGNRGSATSTFYSDLSIVNRDLIIGGSSGSGNLWIGNGTATSTLVAGLSGYATSTLEGDVSIANLFSGVMEFDVDAGLVGAMNLPISSSAASGTIEAYTFAVDNLDTLVVGGRSDALGSVWNRFVGVNTSTPYATEALSVNGTAIIGNFGTQNGTSIFYGNIAASGTLALGNKGFGAATGTLAIADTAPWFTIGDGSASTTIGGYSPTATTTNPYGAVFAINGGNVGIGTASPNNTLVIRPSVAGKGLTMRESDDGSDAVEIQGYSGGGYLRLNTGGAMKILLSATSAGATSYFNTGGNLGVGTASPFDMLSVAGGNFSVFNNSATTTITAGNRGSATSTFYSDLSLVSRDLIIGGTSGSGNLWIGNGAGTSTITGGLAGYATSTFAGDISIPNLYTGIITFADDGGLVDAMDISVSSGAATGTTEGYSFLVDGLPAASVKATADNLGSVWDLRFELTDNMGTATTTIRGTAGTTSTFAGSIAAIGAITAKCTGACLDIAEQYQSVDSVEAGDVVVAYNTAGGDSVYNSSLVEKSKTAYASNVIGVVSTNPGFVMSLEGGVGMGSGGSGTSEMPNVALAGRVPVKVTNENGEIKKGDYLVTSSLEPGRAMKYVATSTSSGLINIFAMALEDWNSETAEPSNNPGILNNKITVLVKNILLAGSSASFGEELSVGESGTDIAASEEYFDLAGQSIINVKALSSASNTWSLSEAGEFVAQSVKAKILTLNDLIISGNKEMGENGEDKDPAVGNSFIKSDEATKVIYNNRIKKNSQIFITFRDNTGGPWWVKNQGDGFFEVAVPASMGYNIRFSYWIVGVEGGDKDASKPVGYDGSVQDSVSPEVSAVSAVNVTETGVTINWATNEDADSVVEYGSSSVVSGSEGAPEVQSNGDLDQSHSINLSGLQPDTTYYYKVKSTDAAGNVGESQEYSFKTSALQVAETPPDENPPAENHPEENDSLVEENEDSESAPPSGDTESVEESSETGDTQSGEEVVSAPEDEAPLDSENPTSEGGGSDTGGEQIVSEE